MGKAGSDSKATRRAAIAARCKSPMEMLFSHIQRRRLESRVLYIHTKYTQQRHTHTRTHTATHTYAYTRQKMREKSMIIGYTSTDSRQKGCHTHTRTHSLDRRSMCVWECVCVTVRASAFCVCLGQKSETETRMRTRTETVAES